MRNDPGGVQFPGGPRCNPTCPIPVVRTCFLSLEPGLEEKRPGLPAELTGEGC